MPATRGCSVAEAILGSSPAETRKQSSSWRTRSSQRCPPNIGCAGTSRDQLIPRAFHLCRCFAGSDRPVAGKKLVLCRGGLGERLLERAFAAGFAGDR